MSEAEFRAFYRHVLSAESVTQAMAQWCRARGLGAGALRSEVHERAAAATLPAGADLAPAAGENAMFRRITLMRGDLAILDADNWFLPARLPDDAARRLSDSDVPFGTALLPGRQTRRTTAVLVPPGRAGVVPAAADILREEPGVALLVLRGVISLDGRAVAFVEERFRVALLGRTGR